MAQLQTITDKWIFFIKEAKNLEVMPTDLGDEGLAQAYHDASRFTWTKEELNAYESVAIREQDERGIRGLAERQAKEEGMAEGNDQGQGIIVRFQASNGKTIEEISANTGLSIERMKELLSKA